MSKTITELVGGELYEYYPLGQHIVKAKGVCDGRPTFKYTRIEIEGILSLINAGETIDSIVEDYQGRISKEAIKEAIELDNKSNKRNLYRKLRY